MTEEQEKKNQRDKPLIVNIDGFNFTLPLAADETVPDKMMSSLEHLAGKLSAIEEKTGLEWPADVRIVGSGSAVSSNCLLVGVDALLKGRKLSPLLDSILYHEASHLLHEDVQSFDTLKRCKHANAPILLMASIYENDPDLLYSIVANGYGGSVSRIESLVNEVVQGIDDYLSPLTAVHSDILHHGTTKILMDMYGEKSIDKALQAMSDASCPPLNQALKTIAIIFSDKLQDVMDSVPEEEKHHNIIEHLTGKVPEADLSDESKQRIDKMMLEKVMPLVKSIAEVENFYEHYSMATEYRCDDFAAVMVDNPHDVVAMLRSFDKGEGLDEGLSVAEKDRIINVHPPVIARIARAEVLADMVDMLRKHHADIDPIEMLKTGTKAAEHLRRAANKKLLGGERQFS